VRGKSILFKALISRSPLLTASKKESGFKEVHGNLRESLLQWKAAILAIMAAYLLDPGRFIL